MNNTHTTQSTSRKVENYVFDTEGVPAFKGRFGNVYRGRDVKNARDVSVTVIPITKLRRNFSSELFQRKVNYLKAIRGPNVVQVYDVITVPTPGHIYVVSETCPNRDLGSLLKKTKVIPEQHALRLIKHIVCALRNIRDIAPAYAGHEHSHLLHTHRQLTPNNLFIHGGRVKVADSGVYSLLEDAIEVQDYPESKETAIYKAPEVHHQIETVSQDKADVWALGVIIYQCLFGELPFKGNTVEEQHDYLERNGLTFPGVITLETKDLLTRMLAINPKSRISLVEILAHPAMRNALVVGKEEERRSVQGTELTLVSALENTFNEVEDTNLISCPHLKPFHDRIDEKLPALDEYNPVQEVEDEEYHRHFRHQIDQNMIVLEEQNRATPTQKVEPVQVTEVKQVQQTPEQQTNGQQQVTQPVEQPAGKGKKNAKKAKKGKAEQVVIGQDGQPVPQRKKKRCTIF